MQAVLTVLFLVQGDWVYLDGWHPIGVDASECERRVEMVVEQLTYGNAPYMFQVTCE
jgi:hypothetical protein